MTRSLNALVAAGDNYVLRGMAWMQGEADANDAARANAYQSNLTNFVAAVRSEIFEGYAAPFVIVQLSDFQTAKASNLLDVVQNAQAAAAATVTNVALVETSPWGGSVMMSDEIHFDADGLSLMGGAMATQLNALVEFSETNGPTYTPSISSTGLVACWRMDEGIGTNVYDATTNAHDGVVRGDPMWVPDYFYGNALDLDGAGDYVEVADDDALSFGDAVADSPFSIAAWVYMRDATRFRIVSKSSSSDPEYSFSIGGNDQLSVRLYDRYPDSRIGADTPAVTQAQNTWTHFAATYDGSGAPSGIRLFKNGAELSTSLVTVGAYTAMHNRPGVVLIGRAFSDGTTYANGYLDDVRIYDVALAPEDVANLADTSLRRAMFMTVK